MQLTTHPQIILICDSCERKLNHAASVLVDGEYRKDYCVTCFLKVDDVSQEYHYYVRPNLNVSITEEGWNVLGELLLMQALEKYRKEYVDTAMGIGGKSKTSWTITHKTSLLNK